LNTITAGQTSFLPGYTGKPCGGSAMKLSLEAERQGASRMNAKGKAFRR
jgi:hypothetical protein